MSRWQRNEYTNLKLKRSLNLHFKGRVQRCEKYTMTCPITLCIKSSDELHIGLLDTWDMKGNSLLTDWLELSKQLKNQ